MGFYALGYANSDSSGPSSNPSNSNDLTQDYGRASFDVRNRLFLSGTASLAHNIRISPFVIANSGAPFNITTGTDLNGDSFYNDRPAFGQLQNGVCPASAVTNQYGCFNLNSEPGPAPHSRELRQRSSQRHRQSAPLQDVRFRW